MRKRSNPWRACLARAALALATMLAAAAPVFAEGYKIGVLHVERILQQSDAAKAAHDRIEREFKPRDDDITRKEEALKAAQVEYEKQRAGLSQDERASRERRLDLQARDIERLRQQFNEDLRARQFEELDKLKGELDQVLTSYAKANDYDLILQDALWVGKSVDITDEVIKALDASMPETGSAAATPPGANGRGVVNPDTTNPGMTPPGPAR
ncbi:MAG TPA: OmpH family outer membrane protein [Casimicrobiaceae bacterium]|nr:OmpH family outer membrane protein [Casimicrobiaceae bacterium]